jgi:hypothetical protein
MRPNSGTPGLDFEHYPSALRRQSLETWPTPSLTPCRRPIRERHDRRVPSNALSLPHAGVLVLGWGAKSGLPERDRRARPMATRRSWPRGPHGIPWGPLPMVPHVPEDPAVPAVALVPRSFPPLPILIQAICVPRTQAQSSPGHFRDPIITASRS